MFPYYENVCITCGGSEFIDMPSEGDQDVCTNCGTVNTQGPYIDYRPEHRNFADSLVDNSRVGNDVPTIGLHNPTGQLHLGLARCDNHNIADATNKATRQDRGSSTAPAVPKRTVNEAHDKIMERCRLHFPGMTDTDKGEAVGLLIQYLDVCPMRGENVTIAAAVCVSRAYPYADMSDVATAFDVKLGRMESMLNAMRKALASNKWATRLLNREVTYDMRVNNMLSTCPLIPSHMVNSVKKTMHEIYERIGQYDKEQVVSRSKIKNVIATLVYMVSRRYRIKVTKTAVCKQFGMSTSTLSSIAASIRAVVPAWYW